MHLNGINGCICVLFEEDVVSKETMKMTIKGTNAVLVDSGFQKAYNTLHNTDTLNVSDVASYFIRHPNALWHIVLYDTLKPYGIAI